MLGRGPFLKRFILCFPLHAEIIFSQLHENVFLLEPNLDFTMPFTSVYRTAEIYLSWREISAVRYKNLNCIVFEINKLKNRRLKNCCF